MAYGADAAETAESSHSDGTLAEGTLGLGGPSPARALARAPNAAIERWLQLQLRQLYREVCSEPVPEDLMEVIERFRRRRQDGAQERGGPAAARRRRRY